MMCLLLCSTHAGAQGNETRRIASTVTYVTVGSVYIGAGRTAGLTVGDTLDLYRAKGLLGRAVITAVSSSSSLASVLGQGVVPAVGDSAVVWKTLPVGPQPRSSAGAPLPVANAGTGTNVVSGRVGLQYSGAGRKGQSPDFSQPAIVGRLDVDKLFSTSMAFRMNGRLAGDMTDHYARYGDATRWRSRVYELSLTSDDPRQGYGFGLGRIFPRFANGLGTFDGGELYGRIGRFTAGVIAGAQANYNTSGIDPDHQKLAAFANVSWGRDIWDRSDVTIAYGQQMYKGKLDRNFTYLQASLRVGPEFTMYGSTEFDFHKAGADGIVSRFNMTNTFVTLSYTPPFRWLSLNAGYDATRAIPLIESERTYVDSLLDRSLRQGLRGSVAFLLPARVVITATGTYRLPSRTSPRASSANASVRASDFLGSGFGLGAQYGAIDGVYTRGRDLALDLDRWVTDALTVALRVDRYEYEQTDRNERHRTTNVSLTMSWRISRAWYAAFSGDRIWEDQITTQRLYVELGMHF